MLNSISLIILSFLVLKFFIKLRYITRDKLMIVSGLSLKLIILYLKVIQCNCSLLELLFRCFLRKTTEDEIPNETHGDMVEKNLEPIQNVTRRSKSLNPEVENPCCTENKEIKRRSMRIERIRENVNSVIFDDGEEFQFSNVPVDLEIMVFDHRSSRPDLSTDL